MISRYFVVSAAVLFLAAFAAGQPGSDSNKRQAWVLGSDLSAAGVLAFEKAPKADVDRRFASATRLAGAVGVQLPAMPVLSGDKTKDAPAVVRYLLFTTGEPIAKALTARFGAEHAAIFDVAMRSHIVLILYDPASADSGTLAQVVRERRAASKLPNGMTDPLLGLIDRKGTAQQLRAEVVKLHTLAPPFIASSEFEANGERLYAAKDYTGSAAEFTKAIAIDPEGGSYYFGRGRAYIQLGRNVEAVADYTQMIRLAGTDPSVQRNLAVAYNNRAVANLALAKHQAALDDLNAATKLRPDYAAAYRVRAAVHQKMGNAAAAKADLAKAESLQPGISR